MPSHDDINELKRRHGRRLLRIAGVSGVGVERGDGKDDFVLAVYVVSDDEDTRQAVERIAGPHVRFVKSGKFRKQ